MSAQGDDNESDNDNDEDIFEDEAVLISGDDSINKLQDNFG